MKKLSWIVVLALGACGSKKTPTVDAAYQNPPINSKGDQAGAPELTQDAVKNWFTKSPDLDGVEGTQADRAYKEFKLKAAKEPIIVAVIDGGVDLSHEDLQGQLWTNTKETPGNGIDDDGNGYIDDVHGWNFLGAVRADGTTVDIGLCTLEVTRQSARLKKLKVEREANGQTLSADEATELARVSGIVDGRRKDDQDSIDKNKAVLVRVQSDYDALKDYLKVDFKDLTLDDFKNLKLSDAALEQRRQDFVDYAATVNFESVDDVQGRIDYRQSELDFDFNENFDPRAMYMHDNADDLSNRFYGNPDVVGDDPSHGTHVSGIIGAVRGNHKGVDGVARDVLIMPIRAVPSGDEFDKDIVNGIHYAVDNGARIISMSFGKDISPHKAEIDAAFEYAAQHNVLLVHAAGNEAQNTDLSPSFPNAYELNGNHVASWLDVGASAAKLDENLPADFSNYGRKSVEIFAPGVDITSTVPCDANGKNCYDSYSGTSMATPVVSGVAALVLSQVPDMSAVDLRQLLLDTARQHTKKLVRVPVEVEGPFPILTYFGELSQTGGIVDAYAALKSALQL